MPDASKSKMERALAKDRLGVPSVVLFVVAAAAPLLVIGAMTTGYAVSDFDGFPTAYMAVLVILLVFAAGFVAMSRHVANAGALELGHRPWDGVVPQGCPAPWSLYWLTT